LLWICLVEDSAGLACGLASPLPAWPARP